MQFIPYDCSDKLIDLNNNSTGRQGHTESPRRRARACSAEVVQFVPYNCSSVPEGGKRWAHSLPRRYNSAVPTGFILFGPHTKINTTAALTALPVDTRDLLCTHVVYYQNKVFVELIKLILSVFINLLRDY